MFVGLKLGGSVLFPLLGGLWGLVQGLFLWTLLLGLGPCPRCAELFIQVVLAYQLLIVIGVAALVGFVVGDFPATIYALVIAQSISGIFSFFSPLNAVLLIGLGVLQFMVGLVGGVAGAYLRELLYARAGVGVAWIPLLTGLVIQLPIIAVSLFLLRSLVLQWDQFSGIAYLGLVMAILVVTGLVAAAFGTIAKGFTSSRLEGGLVIASMILGGLLLLSVSFVTEVLTVWEKIAPAPVRVRSLHSLESSVGHSI